jgi:hypothetical protein
MKNCVCHDVVEWNSIVLPNFISAHECLAQALLFACLTIIVLVSQLSP